jgi:hypothetical protein
MTDAAAVEAMIFEAFPQRVVENIREGCNCEECRALQTQLKGITWQDVPREFIRSNAYALPLLSHDAYLAFLPAWLREGVLEPDGLSAGMVLINLWHEPDTNGFTSRQAEVIIKAAQFMVTSDGSLLEEPDHLEDLLKIKTIWSSIAAQQSAAADARATQGRG